MVNSINSNIGNNNQINNFNNHYTNNESLALLPMEKLAWQYANSHFIHQGYKRKSCIYLGLEIIAIIIFLIAIFIPLKQLSFSPRIIVDVIINTPNILREQPEEFIKLIATPIISIIGVLIGEGLHQREKTNATEEHKRLQFIDTTAHKNDFNKKSWKNAKKAAIKDYAAQKAAER